MSDPAGCEGFKPNRLKHTKCMSCMKDWREHPDSIDAQTAELCLRAGQEKAPTKITENVYLGGWLAASGHTTLKKLGITGVINTAANLKYIFSNFKEAPEQFEYLHLNLEDTSEQPIEEHFEKCIQFINKHIASGGKVLSHCAQGASRSSCIVIAYIMSQQRRPFDKVWIEVQAKRPCTNLLNSGFQRKLRRFQSDLGIK